MLLVFVLGMLGSETWHVEAPSWLNLAGLGLYRDLRRLVYSRLDPFDKAVVEAAGFRMSDIVTTTVFLADLNEFARMNAVYATYFPIHPPARATVQAACLPRDAKVEIVGIAAR